MSKFKPRTKTLADLCRISGCDELVIFISGARARSATTDQWMKIRVLLIRLMVAFSGQRNMTM